MDAFDESVLSLISFRTFVAGPEWKIGNYQTVHLLIVVNPPFSYGEAPRDCDWANGRVSQAASFMDSCIKNAEARNPHTGDFARCAANRHEV